MKLILYQCSNDDCDHEVEELYSSSEEIPEDLGLCPECESGELLKDSFPRNKQVLKYSIY